LNRLDEELPYPQSKNEGTCCIYKNPSKPNSIISSEDGHACDAASLASSTTTRTSIDKIQRCRSTRASIVNNIFQGFLESRIKCSHCQKVIYNLT
jgi:hypothetical protein